MDRGAKCWVTILSQRIDPMLLTGNILVNIIIIMKNKKKNEKKQKTTGRWQARNTHLRRQVVLSRIFKHMVRVDFSYQPKKKYNKNNNIFIYL